MDKLTIGKKIMEVRIKVGYNQTEFAKRIGVAKQTLSNWEHGRNMPDIITLCDIASICGLSLDSFINSPITLSDDVTIQEKRIIKKLRRCRPKTLQAIETILDGIK